MDFFFFFYKSLEDFDVIYNGLFDLLLDCERFGEYSSNRTVVHKHNNWRLWAYIKLLCDIM